MKRRDALIAFAVIALAAGRANAVTAALDLPPSPADSACTEKDPRIRQLAGSLVGCLVAKGQPLFDSNLKPEAVADVAVAGCQPEQSRMVALAKSCQAPPYDTAADRQLIIGMVEDRRSRADFLWYQGDWQKGACSLDDPTFESAVTAHINCMGTGDWSEASQIQSLGALGEAALAQCATKEAPVRDRITKCGGSNATALMSAFHAAEQELTTVVALEGILKQAMPKDASEALRADRLYYLRETYDACVIFETKLRAVAGGDVDAILTKALQVCFTARLDLNDYARQHLSPEDSHAILSVADEEAKNMAGFELEAVGLRAASPSKK